MRREFLVSPIRHGTSGARAARAGPCWVMRLVSQIRSPGKESIMHAVQQSFSPKLFLQAAVRNVKNVGEKVSAASHGARDKCAGAATATSGARLSRNECLSLPGAIAESRKCSATWSLVNKA